MDWHKVDPLQPRAGIRGYSKWVSFLYKSSCLMYMYMHKRSSSSYMSRIPAPSIAIYRRSPVYTQIPCPALFLIPPSNRLLAARFEEGGLPGRTPPRPAELFILAIAPPILTPGDNNPPAPEPDPDPGCRRGFIGDRLFFPAPPAASTLD